MQVGGSRGHNNSRSIFIYIYKNVCNVVCGLWLDGGGMGQESIFWDSNRAGVFLCERDGTRVNIHSHVTLHTAVGIS